jgi:UvrB/UvrC motif-containing protein
MNTDITELLRSWKFDPEANVRRITGADGVPMIQVRVDQGAFQGILQVNLEGRPDGKTPHGMDFVLDFYQAERDRHLAEHGTDDGFSLDSAACQELFDESSRVYGRYIFLLQLKDYERVVRDTERNMEVFRFVRQYAEREEDRDNLHRWWPYILRIHAVARASRAADAEDFTEALQIVHEARERIMALDSMEAEEFHVELERSQEALDQLALELETRKPLSRREVLQQRLAEAIERDEFELAAILRDELKELPAESEPPDPV